MRDTLTSVFAFAVMAAGCVGNDPVLAPMPGCYSVATTPSWSAFTEATGLRQAPSVVGIDSSPDRFLLVPPDWRDQGISNHSASWTEHTMGYRIAGDSVVSLYDKRRRMSGDSMIVAWAGWSGAVQAFLEPTSTGFEGRLFSRSGYHQGPNGRLTLTRRDCGGVRLVSSRPATDPRPPVQEPPPR